MRGSDLKHLLIALLVALEMSTVHAITVGEAIPHTALPDNKGKLQDLSSLHAKAVYVDFWAS